ncbi:ribonuclease P protein component [cyanobiont of Ornithocercus magnificus]|nr:ribonuclease P protein component [cyanobiont of Ornithocercus magnificus]
MILPLEMRIRGHRCFDHLHRYGRQRRGKLILLRMVVGDPRLLRPKLRCGVQNCCRCAVVISNKVHKRAVERNRLRRKLHSHLNQRLKDHGSGAGIWLLLSLRPGACEANTELLLRECDRLLEEIGLLP